MKSYKKPVSTALNSTQFKSFFSSFAGGFTSGFRAFGVTDISSKKNLTSIKSLKIEK